VGAQRRGKGQGRGGGEVSLMRRWSMWHRPCPSTGERNCGGPYPTAQCPPSKTQHAAHTSHEQGGVWGQFRAVPGVQFSTPPPPPATAAPLTTRYDGGQDSCAPAADRSGPISRVVRFPMPDPKGERGGFQSQAV
jgi:hypothetical protein